MSPELRSKIEKTLGVDIDGAAPMPVGFGLNGFRVKTSDGTVVAVKSLKGSGRAQLDIEAYMLRELARNSDLPVPRVYYADDALLIMSWIENDGGPINRATQHHCAEILAPFHSQSFDFFGYETDTLIGPLHQPNPRAKSWISFFRDHRLLYMARSAHNEGPLPLDTLERLESLAANLEKWLIEPAHPSLIHGDLWTGNILVKQNKVAGLIDPAIYFAHPEIELAFSTMFGTFGSSFFEAYESIRPLEPGFHDLRRDLYNLYPTLVHVRLFGQSYLGHIERTLRRLGF